MTLLFKNHEVLTNAREYWATLERSNWKAVRYNHGEERWTDRQGYDGLPLLREGAIDLCTRIETEAGMHVDCIIAPENVDELYENISKLIVRHIDGQQTVEHYTDQHIWRQQVDKWVRALGEPKAIATGSVEVFVDQTNPSNWMWIKRV